MDGLQNKFKAKKATWREESQTRRLAIQGDSRRKAMSLSERTRLGTLLAQLQDEKSLLGEDYAFGREALIKDLDSHIWSAADKAADLKEWEIMRGDRETRLNDEFWTKRHESLSDGGMRNMFSDEMKFGGSHENDEGKAKRPTQSQDVL